MLRTAPSPRSRNPRLEGWMYKKTKGVKGIRLFQRRWVVLYPDACVVAYYKKRTDADKEQTVRNNMGTTVMPWAAAGIIPIDNIESVFPTKKDTRFDIAVSWAAGKSSGKTYQWKCVSKLQRDLWVEAIALVHEQLQNSHMVVAMVDSQDDSGAPGGSPHGSSAAIVVTSGVNSGDGRGETKGEEELASDSADHLQPLRHIESFGTSSTSNDRPHSSKTSSLHSTTSSNGSSSSLRYVQNTRQGSEVIDRLLTTDRFAPLRPPPTSASPGDAPSMSNTVGRSLVGADHMPHSGESDMSDSDTDDTYETDETG